MVMMKTNWFIVGLWSSAQLLFQSSAFTTTLIRPSSNRPTFLPSSSSLKASGGKSSAFVPTRSSTRLHSSLKDVKVIGNSTRWQDGEEMITTMLNDALVLEDMVDASSTEVKEEIEEHYSNNDKNLTNRFLEIENMGELISQLESQQNLAITQHQDPLFKLIASAVSDPTMRIVSSEVGVRDWVERKVTGKKEYVPDSSRLPLDVVWERTMDTIEDIVAHLRRIPYEKGTEVLTPAQEASRKTVVILGSGWAAHALMKVADCFKLRLIVVSPSNHFVFTPMLASSAVGTVEYRSMTEAVRSANPMIDEYLEGKATAVDVANKKITVQLNSLLKDYQQNQEHDGDGSANGQSPLTLEVPYDHLIVSVGCRVDDKGVPGADKALRLKSCDDARRLRKSIGECFEYASRPDVTSKPEEQRRRATFLIVGGGPTGVELAGEILDLTDDITRPHKGSYPKLRGNTRIVLVHSGPDLVPQFNDDKLRVEALKSLERKGAEVILNTRVTEVGDGFAKLSKKLIDEETGEVIGWEDSELPTGVTVWCAGTKPNQFVEELLSQLPESARNSDGRVTVDRWLRPPMPRDDLMGSVLVLGDAAAFPEGDEKIAVGAHLPQTAQVAGQQGAFAARMLDRGYDLTTTPPALPSMMEESSSSSSPASGRELGVFDDPTMARWLEVRGLEIAPQFVFLNLGLLAYLGGGEALTQVQLGDFPLFSYFGSVAFVLWRSVYLVKQVATRNRVLVTFDWIKSAIFGRDMTRF